jgi:CHAD domain-containing protein
MVFRSSYLPSAPASNPLTWIGAAVPPDKARIQAVFGGALTGHFGLRSAGVERRSLICLDTADWRLRRAGLDLVYVERDGVLALSYPDSGRIEQTTGRLQWPTVIDGIPAGPVRDALYGPVWVRALLPIAKERLVGLRFSVLNEDAKTVARLVWWDGALQAPGQAALPVRVDIECLRGYQKDAGEVARLLRAGAPLVSTSDSWLDDVRGIAGVVPVGTQRFEMRPDQPADVVVAEALLGYLSDLEANVAGVMGDVDTEYLHDFRIAVRRTRSIVKLLGDVLPDGLAERVAPEFRWLGQVTTPVRDLDVYLLSVDELAASITRPPDLDPFAEHIRNQRSLAYRNLVRALRSRRFSTLRQVWRTELESVIAAPAWQQLTASELADERVRRIFRKVRKRARLIDADSSAEEVHALRKTCKEMRYLVELFKPLCAPKAYKQVIRDFKDLQDILGEFQDSEVQAAALRQFAQEMIDGGTVKAGTILAMGELCGRFDATQRNARDELTAHHDAYLGKQAVRHVKRLVVR